MATKARSTVGVVVVLAVVAGVGYWYFAVRDTSSSTANLDAFTPTGNGSVPAGENADGTWKVVAGPNVFVGYRVGETVKPAGTRKTVNGRTPAVDGTMTIDGSTVTAVKLTADVTKMASDEALRDTILQNVGLETAKHPTTTFTLTKPLTLPLAPAKGTEVPITATGTLEAHGVTKPFALPLVARWDGSEIVVATTGEGAPFVLADFGVTLPKVPVADVDDHGTIEVQVRFVPA